jgi:AcrR family transcriptional regulator
MRKTRPGGRTAQTRTAVFAAVEALLAEKSPADVSMVEIAERAGVAATSLYRRWGDVRTLLMEVAVERLMQDWPLPDTGTIRGDLTVWAKRVAASLANPADSIFFRVYVGTAPSAPDPNSGRARAVMRRIGQIAAMLDRARARGETTPEVLEVTDHLLAPIYMRVLFGFPVDEQVAEGLVVYLLDAVAARRQGS